MYLSHICTSVGTKDANNLIQGDRKEIDTRSFQRVYTDTIDRINKRLPWSMLLIDSNYADA